MKRKQWLWESGKDKNSEIARALNLHAIQGTLHEMLDGYMDQLNNMSAHLFHASWNYYQLVKCKEQLKTDEMLLVHDFAQNYLCLLQYEPTSKHWEYPQEIIHPSVAYYSCACGKVTTHETMHISSVKSITALLFGPSEIRTFRHFKIIHH